MQFIRQQVVPIVTILIAIFALVATSARGFMKIDLAQPAPIENIYSDNTTTPNQP